MINIFFNLKETRVRSFWRIVFQLFLMILLILVFSAIPTSWGGDTLRLTLSGLAIVISVYVSGTFIDNRPFSDFGLHLSPVWWKELGYGVLAGFLALMFIFITSLTFNWVEVTGYGWERAASEKFLPSLAAYLWIMIWVGFYEELFSRGYHLKNMVEGFSTETLSQTPWPGVLAILVSSVLFSLLHAFNPGFNWVSLMAIVLAGVMLAIPYLATGRLAFAIGLHFSWNFSMGGIFGFNVSGNPFRYSIIQIKLTGPDWITGGSFGPEAGLLGFYAILGILYGVFIWVKKLKNPVFIHPSFFRNTTGETLTSPELKNE